MSRALSGSTRATTAPAGANLAAALAALLCLGCGGGEPGDGPSSGPLRTDSAGVEIVTSHAPTWEGGAAWRVGPEPDLEIGSVEGPEEELLHGVVAVRHAGDDILVAEQTEIRVYDSGGALVRRLGGAGQGPGEFTRMADALWCGGRIVASDLLPPRLTTFDASGAISVRSLPPPEIPGRLNTLSPLWACTATGVLGGMAGARLPATDPPTVLRHPRLVVRAGEARMDTLLSVPGVADYGGMTVPFGRTTLLAATASRVYAMDTGVPEVRIFGHDGTLRRIVRLSLPAVPVTPGDVDRIRGIYLDGVPAGILAELEPLFQDVPRPSTLPHASALMVATDGTLWLRAPRPFRDEEVTIWTVVDSGGVWRGQVDLPGSFTPEEFGSHDVLGVWRNDLDVEFVRRYPIRR